MRFYKHPQTSHRGILLERVHIHGRELSSVRVTEVFEACE
jgi:hypothetical protein